MKIICKRLSSEEFYDKIHKAQIGEAMTFERMNSDCEIEFYYNVTIFPLSRYCTICAENWFGMVDSKNFAL